MRWRVTLRGDGTEICGYFGGSADDLAQFSEDIRTWAFVIASPADDVTETDARTALHALTPHDVAHVLNLVADRLRYNECPICRRVVEVLSHD